MENTKSIAEMNKGECEHLLRCYIMDFKARANKTRVLNDIIESLNFDTGDLLYCIEILRKRIILLNDRL